MDAANIQYFQDILFPTFIEETSRATPRRLFHRMYDRFGSILESKSVRSAVLLYSSGVKGLDGVSPDDHYLQRYYRDAGEALARKQYSELVYASWLACAHGFISGQPFAEIAKQANVFLMSFQGLTSSSSLSAEELFLMMCMCKDLFCCMTGDFGVDKNDAEWPMRTLMLYRLAELSEPFFSTEMDLGDPESKMQQEIRYMRMQMRMYRLQICLDLLLTLRNPANNILAEEVGNSIIRILNDIRQIISHDRDIRSLVDHGQFFDPLSDISAPLPRPEAESNGPEWLKWQPALLTRWKLQMRTIWKDAANNLSTGFNESPSAATIETGMSICRNVRWTQNKASVFGIKSLSSLKSLIVACFVLTDDQSWEGTPKNFTNLVNVRIRNELGSLFNVGKYLRLRSAESKLLYCYETAGVDASRRYLEPLRTDRGGFIDCMGNLRADIWPVCPSCGRPACDALPTGRFD